MIPVKVFQKFKCEFCNKKSVKFRMIRHEKICYYNRDRVCEHKEADDNGDCSHCKIAKEIQDSKKDNG